MFNFFYETVDYNYTTFSNNTKVDNLPKRVDTK